jgi:hypothetical protein
MAITINHQTNDISATSGSLTIDGAAAGGGAYNLISTTTITSTVSSVDFTGLSGYSRYVMLWSVNHNGLQTPSVRAYDSGALITANDYRHYRSDLGLFSSVQQQYTAWLGNGSCTDSMGIFEIDLAADRPTIRMNYGGLSSNNGVISMSGGGFTSGFTVTSVDGLSLGAVNYGTASLDSGTVSVYGVSK